MRQLRLQYVIQQLVTGQRAQRSAATEPVHKNENGIGGIYGDGGTGIESQGLLLNDPSSIC